MGSTAGCPRNDVPNRATRITESYTILSKTMESTASGQGNESAGRRARLRAQLCTKIEPKGGTEAPEGAESGAQQAAEQIKTK